MPQLSFNLNFDGARKGLNFDGALSLWRGSYFRAFLFKTITAKEYYSRNLISNKPLPPA